MAGGGWNRVAGGLVAMGLLMAPVAAHAWGTEGHEVVAALAARRLTPAAAAEVQRLLGAPPKAAMVAVANWADEIRDRRPATANWHFVNIPITATGYNQRRDCPHDDCVVARIADSLATLGNRKLPAHTRAEALRFLIHLVGDLHEPLHAADNRDGGGNGIQVLGLGPRTSMHHLWDTGLVQASGRDPMALAARIAASVPPRQWRAWATGTPADWANQSWRLAKEDIYAVTKGRRNVRLNQDYITRMAPVVRTQLAKAGARLAWLLNRTLH